MRKKSDLHHTVWIACRYFATAWDITHICIYSLQVWSQRMPPIAQGTPEAKTLKST